MKTPGIHVEFVNQPMKDEAATRKEGRPIFKDVPQVHIRWVGDNKREFYAPAHEKTEYSSEFERYISWAEKFPEHWRLFELKQDQSSLRGTPLSEATFLTEARRMELRALNILTVEDLAHIDGPALVKAGMGTRDDKEKASDYLASAAKFAEQSGLREENADLRDQMAMLQKQMAELINIRTPQAPAESVSSSPFADWDDETIRLWIEEQGGEKPHHKCSRETLIRKADDLNAAIGKQKAA